MVAEGPTSRNPRAQKKRAGCGVGATDTGEAEQFSA